MVLPLLATSSIKTIALPLKSIIGSSVMAEGFFLSSESPITVSLPVYTSCRKVHILPAIT
jgi:hypothetical protein